MPLGNLPSGSRASGLSQLPNPGCSPWGWAQRHQPSSESESTWRAEVEGGERERQGHVSSPPSVPLMLAPGATLVLPQPRDACPTAPPPGQGVRQLNGGITPGREIRGRGFCKGRRSPRTKGCELVLQCPPWRPEGIKKALRLPPTALPPALTTGSQPRSVHPPLIR